jgi:putative transposase
VRFAAIDEHRGQHLLKAMCKAMKVSQSGYFSWKNRPSSSGEIEDYRLTRLIEKVHLGSRNTYGSPRVHAMLKSMGEIVSKTRVARLMQRYGIRAKTKRKFKATTNSKHRLPVAPNVLARNFSPNRANQVWAGDITYLWTNEGWLYLAVVLDLFSRKVIGWAMEPTLSKELALKALRMALSQRQPSLGLVAHSDQGSQYASNEYQDLLRRWGISCSMSRRGNCWDNSPIESFFGTLKQEHVFFFKYKTRDEARRSVFEWIEGFYNRERIHSTLGFLSPEDYECLAKVS